MNSRDFEYKVERVIKYKLFSAGETAAKYIAYALCVIAIGAFLALFVGMLQGADSILHVNKLNATLKFSCEDHDDYAGYDGYTDYITPICGNYEHFETNQVFTYIARVERYIKFVCNTTLIGLICIAVAYLMWCLRESCIDKVEIYKSIN